MKRGIELVWFGALLTIAVGAGAGWGPPQFIAELNPSITERAAHPCLSRDGLTLYFTRLNPAAGYRRIMEAYRETPDGGFVSERVLTELVSTGFDLIEPWISADELRLYYIELEASGAPRAKMAQRTNTNEPWTTGRVLSELQLNNTDIDRPTLTEDELIIVFASTRPGSAGLWDLWMASRASRHDLFGNVRPLYEINAPDWDRRACMMPDGLTLYWFSANRGNDVGGYLYRATRISRMAAFEGIQRVLVPDPLPDKRLQHAFVTGDETRIYFNLGGGDIYVSRLIQSTGLLHIDISKGTDLNDGSSRDKALKTIQAGVDRAAEGSTVLVWPGVYHEQVNFRGKAITVQSAADAAVVRAASGYAFSFHSGEKAASVLKNFIIRDSEYGIFLTNGSSPTLSNLTIVRNQYGISAFDGANPDISNCIFWGNTYGDLFDCRARYSRIQSGDEGEGNIQAYPLFADATAGDYHLKSQRGRYVPRDPLLPKFGDPVNLAELNDGPNKALQPCVSADGLTVFFQRYIPSRGHVCIVEAYRDFPDGPFTRQRVVTELADGRDVLAPWISQDELRLYYRDVRIRMAQRPSKSSPWTYVRTFDELHSGDTTAGKPSLTADELAIVFHSDRTGGAGQSDIWIAVRTETNAQFGNLRPLLEINTISSESSAYLLPDGLTLYFTSVDRPGYPGYRIYRCSRPTVNSAFGSVEHIGFVNFAHGYAAPNVTNDERTMYFASGDGNGIYMARAREGHWVLDDVTSPCIDAGDPNADPSGEPMPHGGRINMGAYGGTASASMGDWPLDGDINRDGIVDLADFAAIARDWLNALPWYGN